MKYRHFFELSLLLVLAGCAAVPPEERTRATTPAAALPAPIDPSPAMPLPAPPAPAATVAAPATPLASAPSPAGAAPTPAAQVAPRATARSKPSAALKPTAPPAANIAANPTPVKPPVAPSLDLAALEQRLRDTHAIGLFTKLSLKNQVDDLLDEFRAHHHGQNGTPLGAMRQRYDLLMMKVLTLLQDGDPPLATAISSSREAIWSLLNDPAKLTAI